MTVAQTQYFYYFLQQSINKGDIDFIKCWLQQSKGDLNKCNLDGQTALHLACIASDQQIFEELLKAGASKS